MQEFVCRAAGNSRVPLLSGWGGGEAAVFGEGCSVTSGMLTPFLVPLHRMIDSDVETASASKVKREKV